MKAIRSWKAFLKITGAIFQTERIRKGPVSPTYPVNTAVSLVCAVTASLCVLFSPPSHDASVRPEQAAPCQHPPPSLSEVEEFSTHLLTELIT